MLPYRIGIYILSLLLAFCSLFYEYTYAQILSVCLGGTKAQYLIIISLFTSALGFGSLSHQFWLKRFQLLKVFLGAEILLTLFGASGPFVIAWILRPDVNGIALYQVTLSYLIVFIIGYLSGLEIPSLFALLSKRQGAILAYDYFGMLLASILYPFVFLANLGTAASTLFVANINITCIIWLLPIPRKFKWVPLLINISIFIVVISLRKELNNVLSSIYMGGR